MTLEDGSLRSQDPIFMGRGYEENPKEIFKFYGDLIEESERAKTGRFLDVGCATGEMIYHLKKRFPAFDFWRGIEISQDMVDLGKQLAPDVDFVQGSLLDESSFAEPEFDVVACTGVLTVFDDPSGPINNLVRVCKDKGLLVIGVVCTRDPIDVMVRYRRAEEDGAPWEIGWNQFSRTTIEKILERNARITGWSWQPFQLPFKLEKRPDDPMRTWTIETEKTPYQLVNGANQLIDLWGLTVQIG